MGEEVIAGVTSFLEEQDIRGGFLSGIGAVKGLVLGYFDTEKKEYAKRNFDEVMELGNLSGLVGYSDGKPVPHLHATVAGPEMISFTGHLFRAEAAVAVEIVLTDLGEEIPRVQDKDTGLKLIRLSPDTPERPEE
jgi:predicted DNA-binding protein with PD1-like motif